MLNTYLLFRIRCYFFLLYLEGISNSSYHDIDFFIIVDLSAVDQSSHSFTFICVHPDGKIKKGRNNKHWYPNRFTACTACAPVCLLCFPRSHHYISSNGRGLFKSTKFCSANLFTHMPTTTFCLDRFIF